MAVIYYPSGTTMVRQDLSNAYSQIFLTNLPNTIMVFNDTSDVSFLSASTFYLTASNAISASQAATASFLYGTVLSASYTVTASYALNGGTGGTFNGNATQSLFATQSLNSTSSISSSYSVSSSLVDYCFPYTVNNNTLIGYRPGFTHVGKASSVLIGNSSNYLSTTTNNAVSVGYNAGYGTRLADNTVILGFQAGYNATTASNAVLIGMYAGYGIGAIDTNFLNGTVIGYAAANNTKIGSDTVIIGAYCAQYAISASRAIIIGSTNNQNTTNASNLVSIGFQNGYTTVTCDNAVLLGYKTCNQSLTGSNTIAIGYQAGYSVRNATNCTFIGNQSAWNANYALNLTTIGYLSAYYHSGSYSTIIGYQSGFTSSIGKQDYATLLGYQAGYNNIGDSFGLTCIGSLAGWSITSGSYCTYVGYGSGQTATPIINSIAIGWGSTVTASNQIVIGNTGSQNTTIYGVITGSIINAITASYALNGGGSNTGSIFLSGSLGSGSYLMDINSYPILSATQDTYLKTILLSKGYTIITGSTVSFGFPAIKYYYTASILWPDGSRGVLSSYTFSSGSNGALNWFGIDSYSISHYNSNKMVYQPPITRSITGDITNTPALIIG